MSTPSPAPGTGATPPPATPTTETTPLLTRNASGNGHDDGSAAEAQGSALGPLSSPEAIEASLLRSALLPTRILLFTSGITVILGIATLILHDFWPSGYYDGSWFIETWKLLITSAFFSAFLAVVNLYSIRASQAPSILFNILAHLVLGFWAIGTLGRAAPEFDWDRPRCTDGDDGCFRFRLIWLMLMTTAFISGIVFSLLAHPGLLIFWFIKARTAYGNPGRRQWTIPAGVLTFEFTIKFLRQAPDGSVPPVTQQP